MLSSMFEYFLYDEAYIVILSVLLAIYALRWISFANNLPPGPYNLPILGYLPFLELRMELTFKKISEKFGNVFGLKLGQRYLIVLSSWDAIKEAFIDKGYDFAGRPKPFSALGWILNYEGFMCCSGKNFIEQKRFLLSSLRQLGYGKDSIVTSIQEEAEIVINLLRNHQGSIDDIQTILNTITTNVICSIAFGKRFDHGEEKFKKLLDTFHLLAAATQEVFLFEALPALR